MYNNYLGREHAVVVAGEVLAAGGFDVAAEPCDAHNLNERDFNWAR